MIKLKDILQEEKILVPRHLENRDEGYKELFIKRFEIILRMIQQVI